MRVDSKPVSKWLVTLIAISGFGLAAACSDGDTVDPNGCTPGEQSSCACPGGADGVQVCSSDGTSFGTCDCGGTNTCGNGALDLGEECDDGNTVTDDGCTNACKLPVCGDGIIQDGEDCDDAGQKGGELDTCPDNCLNGGGTGGGGTGGGGGAGGGMPTCDDTVIFAGIVKNDGSDATGYMGSSKWEYMGLLSNQAGDAMCNAVHLGSHVCNYTELLAAGAKADTAEPILTNMAATTTIWVNRTTTEMVNGTPSAPGAGGRCNDWQYVTNHASDGEYGVFGTNGDIAYSLDPDTIYVANPTAQDPSHAQADLDCGGMSRAIPCCNPCTP